MPEKPNSPRVVRARTPRTIALPLYAGMQSLDAVGPGTGDDGRVRAARHGLENGPEAGERAAHGRERPADGLELPADRPATGCARGQRGSAHRTTATLRSTRSWVPSFCTTSSSAM